MKKFAIGIDIDDTLTPLYEISNVLANYLCQEYSHQYSFKPDKIHVTDRFEMGEDLANEYMRRYFPVTVKYAPLKANVKRVIKEWIRRDDIDVYIITARDENFNKPDIQPYNGQMMKEDTYKWLSEHEIDIPKDHIIFSAKDKGETCLKYGISIMIDDDPKHIVRCVECNVPIITIVRPYNRNAKDELISHCLDKNLLYDAKDWIEIEKTVNGLIDGE